MTILVLVLYVLAVARLTRLVNFDTIMDWLHVKVAGRWGPNSWQLEFVECPWCIGMWASWLSAWAPIMLLGLTWWLYPLIALSTSMLIGIAAPLSSDDTDVVAD